MGRATGLGDALRHAGLDVVEYRGWETRGSATFNPKGVVVHHTGPWSTIDGMVRLCINGRSDLPGPLCHVVLDPDGVCHLIAAGRANHAGTGYWKGMTGNTSVLGIEAIHAGSAKVPWPERQVEMFLRCTAAMLRMIGKDEEWCCGHKEWAPKRKIDPIVLNMNEFRAEVGRLLSPSPAVTAPAPPAREGIVVINRPPVKMLTHPSWPAKSYIVVSDDGGVFNFGGAPFHGSLGGMALNQPIIDADVTESGQGYWMLGRDGGVFPFGDAPPYYESGRVEFTG